MRKKRGQLSEEIYIYRERGIKIRRIKKREEIRKKMDGWIR